MKWVIVFFMMAVSQSGHTWGGRGHDSLCRAAAFLVSAPELKQFLTERPHVLGHLCNHPDNYWKSLPKEVSGEGNSSHFIDPEVIGLPVEKIPLDYKSIEKVYSQKPNQFKPSETIKDFKKEFGSSWWRADQFYRRILALKQTYKGFKYPAGFKEEQNNELPYNQMIFDMVVNMGLMGHFIGDNSQPFHNTADYDGWEAGHGGIHSFYEDAVIDQFGANLDSLIFAEAEKIKITAPSFLKNKTLLENMRALSVISANEIPNTLKADPILKKSVSETKTKAIRKSAVVALPNYQDQALQQLARSALLLAWTWDLAYTNIGTPKLSPYKSYRYPFTVPYIPLDY